MQEHRRYVRMSTVFPVEFRILAESGVSDPGHWFQAFTRDVSKGGLCLEFKTFGKDTEDLLRAQGARLLLTINPSFSPRPIRAMARIVWTKKDTTPEQSRYLLGIEYQTINEADRSRLIGFARRSQWIPRVVFFLLVLGLGTAAGLTIRTMTLENENRKLVSQLRTSAKARSEVAEGLMSLEERRIALERSLAEAKAENEKMQSQLAGVSGQIEDMSQQKETLNQELVRQKEIYERELSASRDRESLIRGQLAQIQSSKNELRRSYESLETVSRKDVEAVLKQMIQWLKSHQNQRTGLVASFEGDAALEDVAFTYDQSLACQVFLKAGDLKSAEAILSFFESLARRSGGVFYNAYDALGGAPQEMTVHAGPNLWLGIAALQHAHQTGQDRFVPLARSIGDWAVRSCDSEGGLKGGPDEDWYSTEHNLDAHAFFGMLHRVTGDEKYLKARERSLEWIKKYAYTNRSGRVNRGKGDATLATDTFGWSIAAVGPAKLREIGLEPADIMDFAEEHCKVTVDYAMPGGGKVRLTGFDFAKAQNVGRGGVVSAEWTAQMAVSYKILARYLSASGEPENASRYLEKANFFLTELQKMLVTSPSRTGQGQGCLPYASVDNADTGHGWRTPKGARTGSVAATAYGFFAWTGTNPFELEESHA